MAHKKLTLTDIGEILSDTIAAEAQRDGVDLVNPTWD